MPVEIGLTGKLLTLLAFLLTVLTLPVAHFHVHGSHMLFDSRGQQIGKSTVCENTVPLASVWITLEVFPILFPEEMRNVVRQLLFGRIVSQLHFLGMSAYLV